MKYERYNSQRIKNSKKFANDIKQLMDKEDINGKYIQLIGKRLSVESCLE